MNRTITSDDAGGQIPEEPAPSNRKACFVGAAVMAAISLKYVPVLVEAWGGVWAEASGKITRIVAGAPVIQGKNRYPANQVTYEYHVNGKSYLGSRASLTNESTREPYQNEQTVTVHYRVTEPGRSVLEMDWGVNLAMVLLTLPMSMYFLRAALRSR